MQTTAEIVSDGCERHYADLEPAVRSAVIAEYAARYAKASWLGRLFLQFSIRREIRRRIVQAASDRSLYCNAGDTDRI
jgi:hypothetical protein